MSRKESNIRNILHKKKIDNHFNIEKSTTNILKNIVKGISKLNLS